MAAMLGVDAAAMRLQGAQRGRAARKEPPAAAAAVPAPPAGGGGDGAWDGELAVCRQAVRLARLGASSYDRT